MKKQTMFVLALAALTTQTWATDVIVKAYDNSSTGGTGASAVNLLAGQSFTVTVDPNDLWNAGALPRWSNANGLIADLYYGPGTDAEVPAYADGTLIGTGAPMFGNWYQGNLSAPYGTLVGQIGSGAYFAIGTTYAGTASASGQLKLFYWDENNYDNTGSILAHVNAVPEPETYAMLLAGLGMLGFLIKHRSTA